MTFFLPYLQRYRWWLLAVVVVAAGLATLSGGGRWAPLLGLPLLVAFLPNPTAPSSWQALSSVLLWCAILWYLLVWLALHLMGNSF